MPNKKFQVPINLVNLNSDPATGSEGDMYFNTTLLQIRSYINGAWRSLASGTSTTTDATQVHIYVKNGTSNILPKGSVVYINGSDGTNVTVDLAQANMEGLSSKTLGFLETDLAANSGMGYVATDGILSGLNTNVNGANAGDAMWLSPTVAGGVIYGLANKPSAPYHLVYLGVMTKKSAGNGEIYIHVQNGFELEELHNVSLEADASIADNEVLAYDSATTLWKNQTPAEAGLISVSDTTISGEPLKVVKVNNQNMITVDYLQGNKAVLLGSMGSFTPAIGFTTAAATQTSLMPSELGNATLTLPTGIGTLAKTSDLSSYAPLSGAAFTGAISATSLTLSGDLTINGTTTTINSTTLTVDDKNIELGSVASPTNTTADGGGITLKGTTDKTFNWVNSTSSWTSSENIDLASGKTLKINTTDVLSATSLAIGLNGTTGQITLKSAATGTSIIKPTDANTGALTFTLPSSTGTLATTGQTFYIGTTPITISQGTGTATSLSGLTSLSVSTSSSTSPFNISSSMSTANTTGGTISITSSASANVAANGPIGSNITISSTATASSLRDANGGNISIFTSASGVGGAIGGNIYISTSATSNGSPGSISLSSGTVGTIDNFNIGATTAGTGRFTTLTSTGLNTAGIVTNAASGLLGTVVSVPVANGGTGAINPSAARTNLGAISQNDLNGYLNGSTTGLDLYPRFNALGTTASTAMTSGTIRTTTFVPMSNISVSNVSVIVTATKSTTGSTTEFGRFALASFDGTSTYTILARTAQTTGFATATGLTTIALDSTVNLTAGTTYAVLFLWYSNGTITTTPSIAGSTVASTISFANPKMGGASSGNTDISATSVTASVAPAAVHWARLT